jgi:hypothetical protein
MDTKKIRPHPARLEAVQRRFEHWRRTRKVLSRVPEPLWAAAVKIAGRCGIAHTAKTLRVNYNVLKKRVERQAAAVQSEPAENTAATFLELAPPTRVGCCQCTLELEDASGAKMRIHLHGAEAPDLTTLSRSFWDRGR